MEAGLRWAHRRLAGRLQDVRRVVPLPPRRRRTPGRCWFRGRCGVALFWNHCVCGITASSYRFVIYCRQLSITQIPTSILSSNFKLSNSIPQSDRRLSAENAYHTARARWMKAAFKTFRNWPFLAAASLVRKCVRKNLPVTCNQHLSFFWIESLWPHCTRLRVAFIFCWLRFDSKCVKYILKHCKRNILTPLRA